MSLGESFNPFFKPNLLNDAVFRYEGDSYELPRGNPLFNPDRDDASIYQEPFTHKQNWFSGLGKSGFWGGLLNLENSNASLCPSYFNNPFLEQPILSSFQENLQSILNLLTEAMLPLLIMGNQNSQDPFMSFFNDNFFMDNSLDNFFPQRKHNYREIPRERDSMESRGISEDFYSALAQRESSHDYSDTNGQYLGKYQMGNGTLQDIGFKDKNNRWTGKMGIKSKSDFLSSPEAQEVAIRKYTQKQWGYIKHYGLDKYIGKTVGGIRITKSGLLGGAHLGGIENLKEFLESNGEIDFKDGKVGDKNRTPISKYIKELGGYDITSRNDNIASIRGTKTGKTLGKSARYFATDADLGYKKDKHGNWVPRGHDGGDCYNAVKRSIKKITGVQLTGESAYEAADQLARRPDKFEEKRISKNELKNLPAGAIVVWHKCPKHEHGHISVASGNGKEYSDKVRNQMTEYGTRYRVFIPIDTSEFETA